MADCCWKSTEHYLVKAKCMFEPLEFILQQQLLGLLQAICFECEINIATKLTRTLIYFFMPAAIYCLTGQEMRSFLTARHGEHKAASLGFLSVFCFLFLGDEYILCLHFSNERPVSLRMMCGWSCSQGSVWSKAECHPHHHVVCVKDWIGWS